VFEYERFPNIQFDMLFICGFHLFGLLKQLSMLVEIQFGCFFECFSLWVFLWVLGVSLWCFSVVFLWWSVLLRESKVEGNTTKIKKKKKT